MSKSDGFFVRPKFPVVEPDSSVQPQEAPSQPRMTDEQAQAMIVKSFEDTFGCTVKEKCRTCPGFIDCSMLSVLTGKNLVGINK